MNRLSSVKRMSCHHRKVCRTLAWDHSKRASRCLLCRIGRTAGRRALNPASRRRFRTVPGWILRNPGMFLAVRAAFWKRLRRCVVTIQRSCLADVIRGLPDLWRSLRSSLAAKRCWWWRTVLTSHPRLAATSLVLIPASKRAIAR